MNCPVCNRNLVVSLSICPACGTMMNDSVREELITKKSPLIKSGPARPSLGPVKPEPPVLKPAPRRDLVISKPLLEKKTPIEPQMSIENKPFDEPKPASEKNPVSENRIAARKPETARLEVKHTSPTLVEFQSRENALPEWRLELKNAVRQKLQKNQSTEEDEQLFPAPRVINRTMGATALKPELIEEEEEKPVLHENPTVQNALLRIQQSRQKFSAPVEKETDIEQAFDEPKTKKDFPYYIASRTNEVAASAAVKTEAAPPAYKVAKPKLISTVPAENFKRDTNKLPPLPLKPAKISTSFDREQQPENKETEAALVAEENVQPAVLSEITISPQKTDDYVEPEENENTGEAEDLAPFAMRFNAGLFDMIIGGFVSLVLLAPFVLLGGDWFTTAGMLAFLATCSIVMFIYMTTAVGLFGKTYGMRMFALEIIDIEENDYPTFHQAAVSAAVYLLSLALGGTGFLTVLFTDEKRAVHDIVSGTLMVRDFQEETA